MFLEYLPILYPCFNRWCVYAHKRTWILADAITVSYLRITQSVPTRAKMIHYLRMETLENHTISGGTYLSSLNMRVNPSPRGYIVHNNSLRTHQSQTEGSAHWSQPHHPWKVKYGSEVGNKQSCQKMWLSKHFSIEYRLIVACTVTLRNHVISHG